MIGKVESISKSKSGKAWRVLIEGKFYGANFDSKLDTMLGKVIDFQWDDGKFGPWIGNWGPAQNPSLAAAMGPGQAPTIASMGGTQPRPANTSTGALTEPELRFVSNVIGSAIAAKTIVSPLEISVWAKAAAATVKEL